MGCDIHGWIEKKTPSGSWVGVRNIDERNFTFNGDSLEYIYSLGDRNYLLFSFLAEVRGSIEGGHEPKGFPDDASEVASIDFERWYSDAHTPSYLPLKTVLDFLKKTIGWQEDESLDDDEYPSYDLAANYCTQEIANAYEGEGEGNIADYRMVFWFDN